MDDALDDTHDDAVGSVHLPHWIKNTDDDYETDSRDDGDEDDNEGAECALAVGRCCSAIGQDGQALAAWGRSEMWVGTAMVAVGADLVVTLLLVVLACALSVMVIANLAVSLPFWLPCYLAYRCLCAEAPTAPSPSGSDDPARPLAETMV